MDEDFSDTFLGFSAPRELAAAQDERPTAPATGSRGSVRARPAKPAAAAAGRRPGLGDDMMAGINRNEERLENTRRERDLDTIMSTQQQLSFDVKEVKELLTAKKGKSVSIRKASLFPGIDTGTFEHLLKSIWTSGPDRRNGGNAALHFRRLLVKYCHTKETWSYNPVMRKRLAVAYFRVVESNHEDLMRRCKVDTLETTQLQLFITKFILSQVDHQITQFKSYIKGKIKDYFCMAFGVRRTRCPATDPEDLASFDLLERNVTLNHERIKFVVTELFGEQLKCLGSDDGVCDEFTAFMFNVWNDLRNWSGYGAYAPSYADLAWILNIAEESFVELSSADQQNKYVFFCT